MGTWTALNNQPTFNASTMLLLTDGTVMCQQAGGRAWWRLSPDINGSYRNGSWSQLADMANTRTYYASAVLADGRVVVSGGEYGDAGSETEKGEIYDPVQNTWAVRASSIEIGPALLLPDGRVFTVGATGHTALYTPSGDTTGTGSWTTGPDFPADSQGRLLKAKDAPGCLLPNGRVLCVAGPGGDAAGDWPSPTMFFEFDGTNLVRIADPANAGGVVYIGRMLLLLTGEVLFSAETADIQVYTPDPGFNPAWQPSVTSCPADVNPGGSYLLEGLQLNGLSQAVSYGDDAQMATNYPIVRIRNPSTGAVHYCRTSGHSTMAVATGNATVSTHFTVPPAVLVGS